MTINSFFESYGDKTFGGLDMTVLKRDQAYLTISNSRGEAHLYSTYKDCVKCPLTAQFGYLAQNMTTIISTEHEKLYKVLTKYVDMLPSNSSQDVICDLDTNFGQFGVYQLKIQANGCNVQTLKEPVSIYFPIITVTIIYLILFLVLALGKYLIKIIWSKKDDVDVVNRTGITKKERVKSLDTFRGIAIALMVFVNYGGGAYNFIDHAIWNGLNVADLVFPWFLWIMGVCIPMSIKSTIKSGVSKKKALLNITRRSVILFAIGIFLGSGTNLNQFRVFGVLQRFGIAYFVVASMCLLTFKNLEYVENPRQKGFRKLLSDFIYLSIPWIITIGIVILHTVILFAIPFEDCPSGYLGPGGYHEDLQYINCTGGITGYIDRVILGPHMYHYALITEIYKSQIFDPEGILGCLPTIVHVFLGVQAGTILMIFKDHKGRLIRWSIWALIYGIIGAGLCGFTKEDGLIPLNKHLWSISFVLVTSCFALILLSLCYVLVDITKFWSGKPFLYAGMNAILIYIGHSMTNSNFPIRWRLDTNNTHFIILLENVWGTLMWILVSYVLYKKRLFLTI